MKIDYKKAWIQLKDQLTETEQCGNMLQQSMANAYLKLLDEIELECIIKE